MSQDAVLHVRETSAEETRDSSPPGELPQLTLLGRALLLFLGEGVSLGLGIGFVQLRERLAPYLTTNKLWPVTRLLLLGQGLGFAAGIALVALVLAFVRRRAVRIPTTLNHVARRLAPLGATGFLPLLFQWAVWKDRDLVFLVLTGIAVASLDTGLRVAIEAGPVFAEGRVARVVSALPARLRIRFPRLTPRLPLIFVFVSALGYSVYFSYYTLAWHWSVRSSYDLALENNLVWNLTHGGPFFKTSPLVGPKGSHFGYHATLFAFVLAPFYALAPRAETLLVLQSTLLGFAAVPLFLFARLHVSAGLACLLSIAYLFYPGVHGANLYEFHYLPLGTFFLWTCLYLLESGRKWTAVLAILVTLSVREDVSAGLGIWGAYLLFTGRRPTAGLVLALVSVGYFVLLKMVLMPHFAQAGQESFTFMYEKLLPAGENSFGAVLKTVFGNPWYTLGTLIDEGKLIYLLQIFVPLAFIPFRTSLTLLLALPGFLFTLLSTGYSPLISIHYQYTTHWTTFMFVATVLVLEKLAPVRRTAAMGALLLGLLACSHQYGSILQHNTSFGGPVPYKFGVDADGKRRRHGLDEVLKSLPPRAKVCSSGFTVPQVSSRPDDYTMTIGVFDADYLLFPSERADFIVNERDTVRGLLTKGEFGVVAISPPFALARRGHSTARNAELLALIQ